MKIVLKTLSFFFLSAVVGSISASPALTKEDASNALAKRDLNEDCFKNDRTHPCVWIWAEPLQHYTINAVAPTTMGCQGLKGGGQICMLHQPNGDVAFSCTGQLKTKNQPSGATIHFSDGGQVSFTHQTKDQKWTYSVNEAGYSHVGTAEIDCNNPG